MNVKKTIPLAGLACLSALALSSCSALIQSMWTPQTPLRGEEKITTRATIVSASRGLGMVKRGAVHSSTTFCKFRTDAGKAYRGDMMPIVLKNPAHAQGGYDGPGATTELPLCEGQRGRLTVGSQSGVVHSFIPDDYARRIEGNKAAWAAWEAQRHGAR